MSRLLPLAALCLGLAACASPPIEPPRLLPSTGETPPKLAALEAQWRADVEAGKLPSLAFALVREGRIVHENALGWADKERSLAATVHTPYPLASASKPIVATAVMMLSERGRVDLDARAAQYLPGAPPAFDASVGQLLSHTSGLTTYARIAWRDHGAAPRPLDASLQAYAFSAQPPGTLFEYSNLGYGLLGRIVEARSGQRLGDFLQTALFSPLGMHDAVLVDGFTAPGSVAAKYDAGGQRLPDTWNDTPGAGNLYASAHDLALFAAFHLPSDRDAGSAVLTRAHRRLMQSYVEPGARFPYYGGARYGLGWYVRRAADGETVVWHEGGMPGASAMLLMLPERRIAAAVLINATDANAQAEDIANALIRTIEPGRVDTAFVATEGFARYAGQSDWRGHWAGEIVVDGRAIPFALRLEDGDVVRAEFPQRTPGGLLPAQATFAALVNADLLVGTLAGSLPSADVAQQPGGYILLRLVRHGDELRGAVIAYASADRLEHLLPFAARLQRQAP